MILLVMDVDLPRKLTQVECYARTESGTDDLSLDAMGLEAVQCIIDIYNGRWPGGAVVNGELKGRWQ
jgi:hypothetical protein